MESNETEQKQSKRIKFARLCLSQSRSTVSGSTQSTNRVPSSQISRFFNRAKSSTSVSEQVHSEPLLNVIDKSSDSVCSYKINKTEENSKEDKVCDSEKDHDAPKSVQSRKQEKSDSVNRTIKKFFSGDDNDSMFDFDVPAKVPRRNASSATKKKPRTSKRRNAQCDIRSIINKQDPAELTEEAQLALAIALSKGEVLPDTAKKTISQFEFTPKSENNIAEIFNVNKTNRTRNKWTTKCTLLTRRKDDVQLKKKQKNVDEILLNNILVEAKMRNGSAINSEFYEISSRLLQQFCMPERILFHINGDDIERRDIKRFYTNNLFEPTNLPADSLLRDWSTIPGRDHVFDGLHAIKSKNFEESDREGKETDKWEAANSRDFCEESMEVEINLQEDNIHIKENDRARTNEIHVESFDVNENDKEHFSLSNALDHTLINDNRNRDTSPKPSTSTSICVDDANKTIVVDAIDIETQLSEINYKIRMSQNFDEEIGASSQIVEVHREPSPDLFGDDDLNYSIDNSEPCRAAAENDAGGSDQLTAHEHVTNVLNENSTPADSGDYAITISDDDNNKASSNSITLSNGDQCELIELSDDSNSSKTPTYSLPNSISKMMDQFNEVDENVEVCTQINVSDSVCDISKEIGNCCLGTSSKTLLNKSLSFTDRLSRYEQDIFNDFETEDNWLLNHSHKDSIVTSDNKRNYSMQHSNVHVSGTSPLPSGKRNSSGNFNEFPGSYFDDGHCSDNENESSLINESICNIFEKSFDHRSAMSSSHKKNKEPMRKLQSETTLKPKDISNCCNDLHVSNIDAKDVSVHARISSPISSKSKLDPNMDLSNNEYIIQFGCVSPKPDYENMNEVALQAELRKYGLKPSLKRRQALICLEYIFNRTHPYIENEPSQQKNNCNKKISSISENELFHIEATENDIEMNFDVGFAAYGLADESFKMFEPERIFLPSYPRAKKPWCLQPLHTAWHNLTRANPHLNDYVSLKKPINLRELKEFFKRIDMTFDLRDLTSFLNSHCIAHRTSTGMKK